MKKRIAERVGRIISANLDMLIRSFANDHPRTVIERAITEIDGILEDVRAELGKISVNKYYTEKRLSERNQVHQTLGEKIEKLVAQSLPDQAETYISQQLDIENQIPVLKGALKEYIEKEKLVEGYVKALLAKKREMMREWQEMKVMLERSRESASELNPSGELAKEVVASEILKVESAFDRVLQKKGDTTSSEKLSELDDWVRKTEIKDRLASVKKKLEGES